MSVFDDIHLGEGFDIVTYSLGSAFAICGTVRDVDNPDAPPVRVQGPTRRLDHNPAPTTGQVVRAVFAAYLAFVEHEARETFTYRGARVFGPHLDVDALVEIADRVDYEKAS